MNHRVWHVTIFMKLLTIFQKLNKILIQDEKNRIPSALFVHPNFKILSRNEAYYECGASEKIDSLNINYQDYVTH